MERFLNGLSLLVLGVVAAVLVGSLLLIARHPGYGNSEECHAAYQRARSAADSAMVDARVPVARRTKEPNVLTCGALRRSGEVR